MRGFRLKTWALSIVVIVGSSPLLADQDAADSIYQIIADNQRLMDSGKTEEAGRELEAMHAGHQELTPYEQGVLLDYYVGYLVAVNRHEEAMAVYRQILAIDEQPPGGRDTVLFEAAALSQQMGDHETAVEFLEELLTRAPLRPGLVMEQLVRSYMQLDRPEEAERVRQLARDDGRLDAAGNWFP